jgi:hypothetical protein
MTSPSLSRVALAGMVALLVGRAPFTQIAEAAQGNSSESIEELRTRAEAGDVDAQYNLGVMYVNDRGVPQDDTEAVAWYRKAAEQGEWNSGHTDIKVSEATVGTSSRIATLSGSAGVNSSRSESPTLSYWSRLSMCGFSNGLVDAK